MGHKMAAQPNGIHIHIHYIHLRVPDPIAQACQIG